MAYRYETHLHTCQGSACGKSTGAEHARFYKDMGYKGIIVTDHFFGGNTAAPRTGPWKERVDGFCAGYEDALIQGQKLGLDVFFGWEQNYRGDEYLIYGLDKQWFLDHPEIMTLKLREKLDLMAESGAAVIQAHPFREASYIDHVRLFPRNVHGVEMINACCTEFENKMARIYAENYGLIPFAGSDNHAAGKRPLLAGVCCQEPVSDEWDFINKIKAGKMELFTLANEEA